MSLQPLQLLMEEQGDQPVLVPVGDLVMANLPLIEAQLKTIREQAAQTDLIVDLGRLKKVDMGGAFALSRLLDHCPRPISDARFIGAHPSARKLIAAALDHSNSCTVPPARGHFHDVLVRMGKNVEDSIEDGIGTLAFAGRLSQTVWHTITNPSRLRWHSIFSVAEEAGMNALPIVALLSFFMGAVMAFLSANLLSSFGASLFTVDLVGVTVLREFAVVVTAIILAGRSNSAFTAEIGSMKMQQEIDAMDVLGIDPFEALVLPRVLACLLMLPLLVFGAMVTGLIGGALVSWIELGISPNLFVSRIYEVVDIQHFWVGMSKAPVFAVIISVIGCRQGMLVEGDVESLGRRTTLSVVQALFTVIMVDAIFAMVYMELNI